uniref:Uncharacterized protein n=1 Tax=Panagrolaimus davidi TaxID=227884 RepID=A0A914PYL4_9BILA
METFCQQSFSLPSDSIIYYILMNPSTPELYQKLIQICKYFFINNPILIVPEVYFTGEDLLEFKLNENFFHKISSKIWITDIIHIYQPYTKSDEEYIIPFIKPKVYRNDVKSIEIGIKNMFLDDFIFISSKAETVLLWPFSLINEDGSIVPLEKIIENLSAVKDFEYQLPNDDDATKIITSKTVEELIKIPHFSNLDSFFLNYHVPENFDIENFYENYVKKNKKTKISLVFDTKLSEEYYKRVIKIADEILSIKNHDFKVPALSCPGIESTWKREELERLMNL